VWPRSTQSICRGANAVTPSTVSLDQHRDHHPVGQRPLFVALAANTAYHIIQRSLHTRRNFARVASRHCALGSCSRVSHSSSILLCNTHLPTRNIFHIAFSLAHSIGHPLPHKLAHTRSFATRFTTTSHACARQKHDEKERNYTHDNQRLVEQIKKQEKSQVLYTSFTVNPATYKPITGKPNVSDASYYTMLLTRSVRAQQPPTTTRCQCVLLKHRNPHKKKMVPQLSRHNAVGMRARVSFSWFHRRRCS
jgi:hypothetical protein